MTHEAITTAFAKRNPKDAVALESGDGISLLYARIEFRKYAEAFSDAEAIFAADRDRLAAEVESMKGHINMALTYLGPTAPECSGCAYEWDHAIKELRAAIPEEVKPHE